MTKQTGFHNRTSELTDNYVNLFDYNIPQAYSDTTVTEEYLNVRNNVGVIDLSYLPKIEILGPDAETLCQTIFTRNIKKLGPKSIVYTAMCNEDGGMLDDGTLFRMCDNTFRFICSFPETFDYIQQMACEMHLKVTVKDATDLYSNIAVQGPNSRKVLEKIIWTSAHEPSIGQLACFKLAPARIDFDAGLPMVISRTGYTGEMGYEIWCAPRNAEKIWDAVFEAGKEFDIKPFGLAALDLLRIEAGLIFGGQDFDASVNPYESGIGFVAPLKSQSDDFIGREAIEESVANPTRILTGLEILGTVIAEIDDAVMVDGMQVGVVTSAMYSKVLDKNIAMVRMDIAHSESGIKVEVGKIDGQDARLTATIIERPFYDPSRSKMRLK